MKISYTQSRGRLVTAVLGTAAVAASFVLGRAAGAAPSGSFLPTWKLLGTHEKEHFVAGYLQGWQDAAKVTDIAINYVRTNPEKAIEGLEGIRVLYDIRGVRPVQLVQEIDSFYADPDNSGAGLSVAVTAAKRRLRQ